MTTAYATADDLASFLSPSATFEGESAARLLARASELIDDRILAPFAVHTSGDDEGLPTDEDTAAVLRDACCAQVEFWIEVGEEHDISGLANRQVSIGQLSMSALPPELGPRTKRLLATAGLMSLSPQLSSSQFFGVPV